MLDGLRPKSAQEMARLLDTKKIQHRRTLLMFSILLDVLMHIAGRVGEGGDANYRSTVATNMRKVQDLFFPDAKAEERLAEVSKVVEQEARRTYALRSPTRGRDAAEAAEAAAGFEVDQWLSLDDEPDRFE